MTSFFLVHWTLTRILGGVHPLDFIGRDIQGPCWSAERCTFGTFSIYMHSNGVGRRHAAAIHTVDHEIGVYVCEGLRVGQVLRLRHGTNLSPPNEV